MRWSRRTSVGLKKSSLWVDQVHSSPFKDGCESLSNADAQRGDSSMGVCSEHFVEECCCDSGAAASQWVAYGDGTAFDIEFGIVDVELASAGDGLGCECFVDFKEVDVVDCEFGSFKCFVDCGDWADAHVCGVNAC